MDANTAARVARWQKRLAGRPGRNIAQNSVGRVVRNWRENGVLPSRLTQCKQSALDADRRYLGAPNGVIDLDTEELLTGEKARACLVTKSIPDPYDPNAKDEHIDKLTSHLSEEAQGYQLAALGYALRRGPGRRIYLFEGETKGGKTTFLTAVSAALGNVKANGYGVSIQNDALLSGRNSANPHGHQGGLFGIQDALVATVSELPEGKAKFNTGLLKSLDGIKPLSLRDVGEKAGEARPAKATIFVALNRGDVERLDLTDNALLDRVRILPYPAIPGESDPALAATVRDNAGARQAMVVKLVKAAMAYANDPHPPADIPSVSEAVEERRTASIGEVGQWLLRHVKLTGNTVDRLGANELMAALAKDLPPAVNGLYEGRTRREVLSLPRAVLPGLPKAKNMRTGSGRGMPTAASGWSLKRS